MEMGRSTKYEDIESEAVQIPLSFWKRKSIKVSPIIFRDKSHLSLKNCALVKSQGVCFTVDLSLLFPHSCPHYLQVSIFVAYRKTQYLAWLSSCT